eukprot:TRINITY_DN1258_c0_g1_i1.p1 TRINITY_DN1258_c0_g1~~TRINITY_DN1258_c0_g1_i1.p1  ORF type:complete len:262 (+),score=45.04 TRINITY_DN1258_c0_g1_i1:31-816(+)
MGAACGQPAEFKEEVQDVAQSYHDDSVFYAETIRLEVSPKYEPRPKQKAGRPAKLQAVSSPLDEVLPDSPRRYRGEEVSPCLLPALSVRSAPRPLQSVQALQALQARSTTQSAEPPRADNNRKPGLSGTWLCEAWEGDMEGLLVALNANWAKRCAASLINYGAGFVTRRIEARGDDVEMEIIGTTHDFIQHFRVGAGRQKANGPEGEVWVTPSWQGCTLRVDQTELDMSLPVSSWHALEGEKLVISMLAGGITGKWIWTRS